jgi:D-alanine-D-alanine ligase
MGGLSSERDISLKTGTAILKALLDRQYQAIGIDVDRAVADTIQKAAIDVCFIALHGTLGEDGAIQGLLEIMGIPYTGSGVLASALAMNKVSSKKLFCYHGLPTPVFQAFSVQQQQAVDIASQVTIPLPLIVKPSEEGSTIGVTIVKSTADLLPAIQTAARYGTEILVEQFIVGREVTAGILHGEVFPLIEIIPQKGFYDYHAKYQKGETDYVFPEWLSDAQDREIKDNALHAYQTLGCSGAARVDFMVNSNGAAYILEVNTVPGMTETSLLPKAARKAGIEFPDLVEKILWSATFQKTCTGGLHG